MLIRTAQAHEVETVKEQRLAAYEQYKKNIPADHWTALRNTLASDNDVRSRARLFVAEMDGIIAGSVALFAADTQAYDWDSEVSAYPEIRMLAVDPQFRGKGIGKALLLHCIEQAKTEGSPSIGLHTGSFMKDAISLYERLGFQRVPERDFTPLDDGIIVKAFQLSL